LADKVGNYQSLDAAALAKLGFPTVLTVINSVSDTTPPELTGLNIAPTAIDVSSGSQAVTFTLDIQDDLAGFAPTCGSYCSYGLISLMSPSGKQNQGELSKQMTLLSGTPEQGQWQIAVNLPQYAEAGKWTISSLWLQDTVGNGNYLSTSSLQSLGFPTSFTVTSSPSDTEPPQLVRVDISPTFVDTSARSATVTATLQATDNLSGILHSYRPISPNVFNNDFYISFQSPSGNQGWFTSFWSQPIAGTDKNGTWQGTADLPQFSEAGTWKPYTAVLVDNAGNTVTYDSAQLAALGVPSLEVIRPSLDVDGTVSDINKETTISDTVFGDRAQVTIPAGVLTQPTTISIDVLNSDLNLPMPVGFSTTGTRFVNIHLDPKPTPPYPAPGITLVLPVDNQTPPGTLLTLYRVDPDTGNLTPEPSAIPGQPVTGTVNADGLSATFTGVASLSTVVGLISSGTVPGDLNGDAVVDCADIAIVKNAFGTKGGQAGFDSRADTNHDKVINIRDLSFVSRELPKETVCRITPTGAVQVTPTVSH
jgi:hypothetical protein